MGWVNVASRSEGATCETNHVKELGSGGWRYECYRAIDGNFRQHMAWAPGVIPAYMEVYYNMSNVITLVRGYS